MEKPRAIDINESGIIFHEDRAIGNAATRVHRQQFRWLRKSEIPLLYLWVEVNAIAKTIDPRFKVTATFMRKDELSWDVIPMAEIHLYFEKGAKGKKRWAHISDEAFRKEALEISKAIEAHGFFARPLQAGPSDRELEFNLLAATPEEAARVMEMTRDAILLSPLSEILKD